MTNVTTKIISNSPAVPALKIVRRLFLVVTMRSPPTTPRWGCAEKHALSLLWSACRSKSRRCRSSINKRASVPLRRCPTTAFRMSTGQFIYVIRKRIKLDPEKAIFIFVNDTIPQTCERKYIDVLCVILLFIYLLLGGGGGGQLRVFGVQNGKDGIQVSAMLRKYLGLYWASRTKSGRSQK